MGIEDGTSSSRENCKVRARWGGGREEGGGVRNRKKEENKRGKDDAVERRARRELKRVGEK